MRFSLFDNAMMDFHIYIDGIPVDKFTKENSIDKNFGGHICKTRINY